MTTLLLLYTFLATASAADPVAGKLVAGRCVPCHGVDGASAIPSFPRLSGQQGDYIIKQLVELKAGVRTDPIMRGIAVSLQPVDAENVAAYLGTTPRLTLPQPAELPADVEQGRQLYQLGDRARGIPPCQACHGAAGQGDPGVNGVVIPAISGQHVAYTVKQLVAFRAGTRTNDFGTLMQTIAKKLTDADITAVADYLATVAAPAPTVASVPAK